MRSSIRRTMVLLLVTAFLIPGILQAGTPQTTWERTSTSGPEGFFSMVWNLLASLWDFGSGGLTKSDTGSQLDPAGTGTSGTGTSSTSGSSDGTDTGSQLDPAGKP